MNFKFKIISVLKKLSLLWKILQWLQKEITVKLLENGEIFRLGKNFLDIASKVKPIKEKKS